MPLPPPIAAGAANPAVEHLAVVESNAPTQALYEVPQFGLGLRRVQLVHDLERHRNDGAWVVGKRRFRHQDEKFALLEAPHYLLGGLLPRELPEELLDVLDFERAAVQRVLLDQVFQWVSVLLNARAFFPRGLRRR